MSLFLSDSERATLHALRKTDPIVRSFYWGLLNRAEKRAASPGLLKPQTDTEWWHHVSEYLTDGAMAFALKPSPGVSAWVRDVTLSLVRRPVQDWVGPAFRAHSASEPVGHLETAHLSWAVALALDLAADVFTEEERDEIAEAVRQKGMTLCQRWLDQNTHLANWRCVLNAGTTVAAAVLNDADQLKRSEREFRLCQHIFQTDGSHGESLQYGNYAAYAQMVSWEALVRHSPDLADRLPLEPYVHMPRWQAASHFCQKSLTGWGGYPVSLAANFNDSSAIFRPSADLLLHIAARGQDRHPQEAGLARWLFETTYLPEVAQGPHDRASFGFVNDYGFLTLPLITRPIRPVPPPEAGVTELAAFSCGDVLVRDAWNGNTILAIHGGGDALRGPGHLHGDLNSFILVHNQQRLLVDPGHSCYRNLIHDLEGSSLTHNTCTFSVEADDRTLQQSRQARSRFDPLTNEPLPPADRGARRILSAREGRVSAVASDAAALYGTPLTEFTRFWFLCGSHVVFIVDHIASLLPVKTSWNWLLNNRDGHLDLKPVQPDRLVVRRGNAGMKLFHLGGGTMGHPQHAYVHDAYHPLPNQHGEGKSGSGSLVRWTEKTSTTKRTVVHAICLDDPAGVTGWHLRTDQDAVALENPGATEIWKLETGSDRFLLTEKVSGESYLVSRDNNQWAFRPLS